MSRIAIAGAHATGKSTLAEHLASVLPSSVVVEEPYYTLIAQGHTFADVPDKDDFLLLLEHSARSLTAVTARNAIFDRCPADFLAYMVAVGASRSELAASLDTVRAALASLDLVCFVPIERPNRIPVVDGKTLRRRVDVLLREMLLEDSFGFGAQVCEVRGSVTARAAQVQAALLPLQPGKRARSGSRRAPSNDR